MLTEVKQLKRIFPSVVSFEHKIPDRIGTVSCLTHPSASHKPYQSAGPDVRSVRGGCQLVPQREHTAAGITPASPQLSGQV